MPFTGISYFVNILPFYRGTMKVNFISFIIVLYFINQQSVIFQIGMKNVTINLYRDYQYLRACNVVRISRLHVIFISR